jgi:alpha-mannosidase
VAENQLSGGGLRVKCDRRGSVSLTAGEVSLEDMLLFEDRFDGGDLYTPSIGRVIAWPKLVRRAVVHSGPLVGELAQEWTFERERRKGSGPQASVSVGMRLTADSPLLELRVRGINRARDHRLRIGIATGIADATVVADAAFGPVERKPVSASDEDRRMETPPATAPLQRYVSLYSKAGGVTVHSDGLAEYEVDGQGIVWVTLVRAVGQLSRNDIPERPGHAGWPEPTPKAQSLGPFVARLAVQVHGPKLPATQAAVDRESDRFLNPVRGFTLRASASQVGSAGGIELSGTALSASAIKESEDGRAIVLRCVNLSDRPQAGTWTLWTAVDAAHLARLDETAAARLDPREQDGRTVIEFAALPRAVTTILVTPRSPG